ncbi:MAG: sulfatase [Vallitalea sp.]|jgi:arylsulfatase|nr:sulfatase [Vallitalea sp.]
MLVKEEKKQLNIKPNIILIFTDDQGYYDLSVQGNKEIYTPCIDEMANEGIRLTNFHAQPVCGPSRAALMTGCYPQRIGQVGNKRLGIGGGHPLLHSKEITIAEILKKEGYKTGMIGKWHLGLNNANSPTEKGFDTFFGTPGSNDGLWVDKKSLEFSKDVNQDIENSIFPPVPLIRDKTVIEFPMKQTGITTRYTDEAIDFIKKSNEEGKSFFLYMAHNMPHVPLFPGEKFKGQSKYGIYGDCIEEIDWNTGRLIQTLKDINIDENTMVIFTSDNGPWLRPDLVETRECGSAYPLRGGKLMSWEGGFRVPCIIRMPSLISGGQVSDKLTSTLDILPTLTHLAGGSVPNDRAIDGENIIDILRGCDMYNDTPRTFYFYIGRNLQAVQHGKWKLILARPDIPDMMDEYWASHFGSIPFPQLYDISQDISEENDVANKYPEVVEMLLNIAKNAREELGEGSKIGKGERFWEDYPLPGTAELDGKWKTFKDGHGKKFMKGMVIR